MVPLLVAAIVGGCRLPLLPWVSNRGGQRGHVRSPPPIDGERAYEYLKQICEIGPRTAGSEANAKQRKLVADHFTKMGATVQRAALPGACIR